MPRPTDVDRHRALYVGVWRIDLVRRAGTPRILSDTSLSRTAAHALEATTAPRPASLAVVLSDDAELRDLNRAHLGHDEPTDVLSFPMLPPEAFAAPPGAGAADGDPARHGARTHLGDIAISVERAIDQAEAGRGGQTGDVRWSPADELRLLVTHGVLHVCGWDHAEPADEAAMRALEQRLLEAPR